MKCQSFALISKTTRRRHHVLQLGTSEIAAGCGCRCGSSRESVLTFAYSELQWSQWRARGEQTEKLLFPEAGVPGTWAVKGQPSPSYVNCLLLRKHSFSNAKSPPLERRCSVLQSSSPRCKHSAAMHRPSADLSSAPCSWACAKPSHLPGRDDPAPSDQWGCHFESQRQGLIFFSTVYMLTLEV